jgi:tRNA G18 (ribose-2'-O)-methylase SpoU
MSMSMYICLGGIESLNAGAAGAIILAEAARQRRRGRQQQK